MGYEQSFNKRNQTIIAEPMAEEYFKSKGLTYTRYGFDALFDLDRNDFIKIPSVLRSTPDFMVIGENASLVEAKGCIWAFRLKVDDLKLYEWWDKLCTLYIFVYSTAHKTHKIRGLKQINDIISGPNCTVDTYPDNGKLYYKIPFKEL